MMPAQKAHMKKNHRRFFYFSNTSIDRANFYWYFKYEVSTL